MNAQPLPFPSSVGAIADPGQRDQFNVLLWTSLAGKILGLPSSYQAA